MKMPCARDYLNAWWDGRLPVHPSEIAKNAGVTVQASLDIHLQRLSGRYDIEAGAPVIRYAQADPLLRQRFTIAHALGHHVLGHGASFQDPVSHFSIYECQPKEIEANRFAFELLMPEDAIEYLIRTQKHISIERLAQRMQVSQMAMQLRLKGLKWI